MRARSVQMYETTGLGFLRRLLRKSRRQRHYRSRLRVRLSDVRVIFGLDFDYKKRLRLFLFAVFSILGERGEDAMRQPLPRLL